MPQRAQRPSEQAQLIRVALSYQLAVRVLLRVPVQVLARAVLAQAAERQAERKAARGNPTLRPSIPTLPTPIRDCHLRTSDLLGTGINATSSAFDSLLGVN